MTSKSDDSINSILNQSQEVASLIQLLHTLRNVYMKKYPNAILNIIDITKDKLIINNHLLKGIKNTINLSDETIVEHFKTVSLGLFSVFRKRGITIYDIYRIADEKVKNIIIHHFKNIYTTCQIKNSISKLKTSLIVELNESSEIKRKLGLVLNFNQFKSPKYLAAILDLLAYKNMRTKLFELLIFSRKKITMDFLYSDGVELTDEENEFNDMPNINSDCLEEYFENLIQDCIKENYFDNMLQAFMLMSPKGRIFVRESDKNKTDGFINTIMKESQLLNKWFDNNENRFKSSSFKGKSFKESIIVEVVPDDTKITSEFINSYNDSLKLLDLKLDEALDSINNNITISFTKRQVVKRLLFLFYYILTRLLQFYNDNIANEKNSKINIKNPNEKIKNIYNNEYIDLRKYINEDYMEIIEKITTTGFFTENENGEIIIDRTNFSFNSISNAIKTEASKIIDQIDFQHSITEEDKTFFQGLIDSAKNIKTQILDVKEGRQEFTCFSEFMEEAFSKFKSFKLVIVSLLSEKNLSKIEELLNTNEYLQINPNVKEYLIKGFIKFLQTLFRAVKEIIDSEQLESDEEKNRLLLRNEKIFICTGKSLDSLFSFVSTFLRNIINTGPEIKTKTTQKVMFKH